MHQRPISFDEARKRNAHPHNGCARAGGGDDRFDPRFHVVGNAFESAAERLDPRCHHPAVQPANHEADSLCLDLNADKKAGFAGNMQPFRRPPPAICFRLGLPFDKPHFGKSRHDRRDRGFVESGPLDNLALRDRGLQPYSMEYGVGMKASEIRTVHRGPQFIFIQEKLFTVHPQRQAPSHPARSFVGGGFCDIPYKYLFFLR